MRKRQPWVWVLAAAGCVALAPAARAQVFVGPAVPNYAFGGFGGFFPGAYGSSWSNGFSRYGPPVPVGPAHFYKIRARWRQDGEVKDETRSVAVKANESVVVDFTQPEPSAADKRPVLGND